MDWSPGSPARSFATSTAVYAAAMAPALWLLGGSRGLRLLGASLAAGGAATAVNVVVLRRAGAPVLPAAQNAPTLTPADPGFIDVMGGPLGSDDNG